MNIMDILLTINYVLCALAVFNMIFIIKKKPSKIIDWTLLLIVPFLGLFIYLLFGAGLSLFDKRMIKKYELSNKDYNSYIKKQVSMLKHNKEIKDYPQHHKDLILLNLNTSGSICTFNNNIEYFSDNSSAFESLLDDIKNAESSIHLEFYIFANDKTGKRIRNLLVEKAKQGVEVRVLYDAIGSFSTSNINFRKLKKNGGQTAQFFPPFLNIKLLNFKANYRNHRKICVIDGKIGYTGGFNIRDDHMGKIKHLSPWRDTTVRLSGEIVHSLQNVFLSDWRFSTKDKTSAEKYINKKYFPVISTKKVENVVPMQLITSGPNNARDSIKVCIEKMINSAKKSVKIQTPYFIPDDAIYGTIKLALLSGIEVSIMIPQKIDHWYVHFASLGYIDDLLKYGLKVYVYNGFIHSKVVVCDDEILTLGSCNIDIRSFSLNFEDNLVVFDKKKSKEYVTQFEEDVKNCTVYNSVSRKRSSIFVKLLVSFCRLFSAIL